MRLMWRIFWSIWTGLWALALFFANVSPAVAVGNSIKWLKLLGLKQWAEKLEYLQPILPSSAEASRHFSADSYWRHQDAYWWIVVACVMAFLLGVGILFIIRTRQRSSYLSN